MPTLLKSALSVRDHPSGSDADCRSGEKEDTGANGYSPLNFSPISLSTSARPGGNVEFSADRSILGTNRLETVDYGCAKGCTSVMKVQERDIYQ